jgi:hypothetical protein
MDTALQALLSYQFVLFCLAVSAFTYVVTMVVNYVFRVKGYIAKENHLWSDLILPLLPLILGSVGALVAKQYPYPVEIVSASGRFAFGLVAGLLSGFAWRWVKAIIGSKMKALGAPAQPPSADGASAGIVDDTETKE